MAGVEDIGGGHKLLKFSAGGQEGPIEQVKNVYSLADLAAKLRMAPSQLLTLQAEAIVKAHEADPMIMAIKDANSLAELQGKIGTEQRAKTDFLIKAYASVASAAAQNTNLGKAILKSINPGAHLFDNQDGTHSMSIPQPDGSWNVVKLDPNRLGDPAQRESATKDMREAYAKFGQGFSVVHEFHNNLTKLNNLPNPTGAADVGVLFSYMKIYDRNVQVGEGQFATAQNAPNVPEQIRNMYNRAMVSEGPILGPAGSATRLAFQQAADTVYGNARADAVQQAKFFAVGAEAKLGKGSSKFIIQPFGGITPEEVLGGAPAALAGSSAAPTAPASPNAEPPAAAAVPAGLPAPSRPRPTSSEAGVVSTAQPSPAPVPAPTPTAERIEDTLKNMFTLPGGN